MTSPGKAAGKPGQRARTAARLAVVQALYQMELSGSRLADILAQYGADGAVADSGDTLEAADSAHFENVLRGILDDQAAIDRLIDTALVDGWPLGRLDATLRAILRAGAYEITSRRDIPFKVAISEYVDVAHAFYAGEEPGMVNGVLDAIARAHAQAS